MSLFVHRSPWFSLGPRITILPDELIAETNFLFQVLGLFFYGRTVHVDRRSRYVFIKRRIFWFSSSTRVIPFKQIDRVEYAFDSTAIGYGRRAEGYGATAEIETFTVDLVLEKDEEHVPLVSFRGHASVPTGIVGVLSGGDVVGMEGTQETDSHRFVMTLLKYLGVELGKPTPVLKDAAGKLWRCSACQRVGAPAKAKCLYCGGKVIPET